MNGLRIVDRKDGRRNRVLPCKLSCQLDRLALLVFSIEDFNLEMWETRL